MKILPINSYSIQNKNRTKSQQQIAHKEINKEIMNDLVDSFIEKKCKKPFRKALRQIERRTSSQVDVMPGWGSFFSESTMSIIDALDTCNAILTFAKIYNNRHADLNSVMDEITEARDRYQEQQDILEKLEKYKQQGY